MFYPELEYYPGRHGESTQKIKIKVTSKNVKVHPYFYQYETSEHEHYDYGIIILEQHLENEYGCVEIAANYQVAVDQEVFLFGYPVEENMDQSQTFTYGSKGKIQKLTESLLFYDLETGAGESGAPILIQHQGQWKIVGIHTISDPSGIYINSDVAKTLNAWISTKSSSIRVEDGSTARLT
jgi:V8-like Glu-specific endopeptidase